MSWAQLVDRRFLWHERAMTLAEAWIASVWRELWPNRHGVQLNRLLSVNVHGFILSTTMAAIKCVYVGGGSTRAPGTISSLINQGKNFEGSEIILVDLDPVRLELVTQLARKMAAAAGHAIRFSWCTSLNESLKDCQAVLSSFRPGGFEARMLDEKIPLKHGVIGQETQGPGGFFMALRSITALKPMIKAMEKICPEAWLINYTNPVNIVAEAVSRFSPIKVVSLCEGPIVFPRWAARTAGLDPDKLETASIGLNHASWSVRHLYEGREDFWEKIDQALEAPIEDKNARYCLRLASAMRSFPSHYFQYYYYGEEVLADLKAKTTSRAEDILGWVDDYWKHYQEQLHAEKPLLDPKRSRGGIHELELGLDVMDAIFNDRDEIWTVNVPNRGALPDFPDERVVEVPGRVHAGVITPVPHPRLPRHLMGLLNHLADYQCATAEAAWKGRRLDGVRALSSHPFMRSLDLTETLYDEMANAHRAYLPERLLG